MINATMEKYSKKKNGYNLNLFCTSAILRSVQCILGILAYFS